MPCAHAFQVNKQKDLYTKVTYQAEKCVCFKVRGYEEEGGGRGLGASYLLASQVNKSRSCITPCFSLQVYKDHEMLGWYSVGTDVTPVDTEIHK